MSTTIPFANDGKLGVDTTLVGPARTSAEGPEFALGTQVRLDNNKAAVYVKFAQATTYSSSSAVPCAVGATFIASASAGGYFAYATYAAGEFGWAVASGTDA